MSLLDPRIPSLPPTSSPTFLFSDQILTFPLPAGPMTSCAYRGMSAVPVVGAARLTTEADHTAPFSLRAALTEFREPHVRTNRNPKSLCAFCSSTSLTTERPAGQISCETPSQETLRPLRGGRGLAGRWAGKAVCACAEVGGGNWQLGC